MSKGDPEGQKSTLGYYRAGVAGSCRLPGYLRVSELRISVREAYNLNAVPSLQTRTPYW